jgi:hypothetical protein
MKVKYNWIRLREGTDGLGGDGGGGDNAGAGVWGDPSQPEQHDEPHGDDPGAPGDTGPTGAPEPPAQPQAQPGQVALTPEQWMQIQQMQQQSQPQAQPELTEEQLNEQLKVYQPNEGLVDQLFGDNASQETRLNAFNEMVSGIVTHLTTVMGYSNQIMAQDMQQQFSPALDMVREQKDTQFVSNLEASYPALKGQGAAVRQVMQTLRAQGYVAQSAQEAQQTVATQVEQLMRSVNPNFSLSSQARTPNPGNGSMPRMAPQGAGGGGGAGPGGGGKDKPSWDVFS